MEKPVIVIAPSNRSKCKACAYLGGDPTIKQGSMRVGIPGHASGVTVFHWCHPTCFAQHCIRVDHAPTGRAKCKADGTQIDKGAIRLLIGYKKESSLFKLENVRGTIVPELLQLVGRSQLVVHGLDEFSLDERQQVESSIFGEGQGGGATTSKKRAVERQEEDEAATTTTAKKGKKQRKEKQVARRPPSPDGDACD